MKVTIKIILVFLNNSFFNSSNHENERQKKKLYFIFHFYKNEKQMGALKRKSRNLLNMKVVAKSVYEKYNSKNHFFEK